jgi:hypothetical protein
MEFAKTSEHNDTVGAFVQVRGVVHLETEFGVFLNFQSRTVFVSVYCMQKPDRISQPGEDVTLHVSRSYAKQEGLIACT